MISILITISLIVFLNVIPFYHTLQYNKFAPKVVVNQISHIAKENQKDFSQEENARSEYCETIHLGFICTGAQSNLFLHSLLKSVFYYRMNPLHLHIITNHESEKILATLLETWSVPQVNYTFYNLNDYTQELRWIPNSHYSKIFGLLKLIFPTAVPLSITKKIIILDVDITLVDDILELWKLFKNFNKAQVIGLVENQSNYYLKKTSDYIPWPAIGRGFNSGVILYHLERLKEINWPKLWKNITKHSAMIYGATRLADQDIINAVIKEHDHLVYQLPCFWNTQLGDHTLSENCYKTHKVKLIHWNSPKKMNVENKNKLYFRSITKSFIEYNGNLLRNQLILCSDLGRNVVEEEEDTCQEFHKPLTKRWRTLLFIRNYKAVILENDVTLVTQLSYDRLQMIEKIVRYWPGPISITLYVSDAELDKSIEFINNSDTLQERTNVAYHAVFRDGEFYPINILRNVGLRNVETPYVFLVDIDFIPMTNMYNNLLLHLTVYKDLRKKALVVPAFEMQLFSNKIPKSKARLLGMLPKKVVIPFLSKVWAKGHSATDYKKWYNATTPYKVEWEPDFEPYVVVRSDVTEYDERFVGFGWNKVSHIMELKAQDYEFIVLPDVFVVHSPHTNSYDIAKFRTSPTYRLCLQILKDEFIRGLNEKYGTSFDYSKTSVTFPTDNKRRKRNFISRTTEETNTDYPIHNE